VVGADFVGVRSSFGGDALVRVDVIATVRTQPGERSTAGDRLLAARLTLAEVLARLAGDRERVTLVLDGAGAVGGTLRSVGADVVAVRLEGGGPAATSYVPLAAVGEVLVGA
jgi:hypothetical protein